VRFKPSEVRLSEIARQCDRMSVLRGQGAAGREPDDEAREYFARGQLYEQYVVDQLVEKFGVFDVEGQVDIHHPLGVGHADAYIKSIKTLVEVKSTSSGTLSTPVYENGVRQLKLYLRFHPDAEEGWLMMINPSTLRAAERYKVLLADGDAEEIDQTIAAIQQHITAGTLPDRACAHPGQSRSYFCPFAAACFDGWEPPVPYTVTSPAALTAAGEWNRLVIEARELKSRLGMIEDQQHELKETLVHHCPEGDSQVGGFAVKRWHVDGRNTFQFKAYEAAGEHSDVVERFTVRGNGHDRVTVKATTPGGTDGGSIDYGDDAPF
jgi:hypothetical protein